MIYLLHDHKNIEIPGSTDSPRYMYISGNKEQLDHEI